MIIAALLAMTGLVSPWGILVLPLVVAGVVKAHDLLAGRLAADPDRERAPDSSEPPVGETRGSTDST